MLRSTVGRCQDLFSVPTAKMHVRHLAGAPSGFPEISLCHSLFLRQPVEGNAFVPTAREIEESGERVTDSLQFVIVQDWEPRRDHWPGLLEQREAVIVIETVLYRQRVHCVREPVATFTRGIEPFPAQQVSHQRREDEMPQL